MGKVTETHTEINTVTIEGIPDSSHKQWMTKKNNKISELTNQLVQSIPKAAHNQWMTKKIMRLLKRMPKLLNWKQNLEKNNDSIAELTKHILRQQPFNLKL